MSQPANDVFSQHLSDDEASFHEDASDNEFQLEKMVYIRVSPPPVILTVKIHALKKERKGQEPSYILAIPNKSNTNKVKSGHTGAYSTYTPSTSSNNILEREVTAGFADEVIYSLFAKQSEDLDLLHEDLE
ncbi:hypothetical protein Tco_0920833 [Tanacetum coccineum]